MRFSLDISPELCYTEIKTAPRNIQEKEVTEMDIKARIDEVVNRIKNDPDIASKFKDDPVKTVEGILGVDLPDDVINQIIEGVRARVNVDDLKKKLGGLGNFLGGR